MRIKLIGYIIFLGFISVMQPNYLLAQQQKHISETIQKEIDENLAKAKSMELSGDYNQAGYFYNNVATTYWANGIQKEAIANFLNVINMYEKIGNRNAIKNTYNNIGMAYTDLGDYPNALVYFEKCLVECRSINKKPEIVSSIINIANTHSLNGNYEKAIKTLTEATTIAQELNDAKLLKNVYSLLAEDYEKLGNTQKSSEYFALYSAITKKIQKEEIQKKEIEAKQIVDEAQSKVQIAESQKQQTQIALEENKEKLDETKKNLQKTEELSNIQKAQLDVISKERELQNAVIKNQKLVRNIFIAIIIGVLAFAFMVIYALNQKKKANILLEMQNKEILEQRDMIEQQGFDLIKAVVQIEKQNKDITSSINYAKQIQEALLPTEDRLHGILPDSFVLFKPRDVVSGDFYWFTGYSGKSVANEESHRHHIRLSNIPQNESGFIITAADCTGHGVPGAFMSMIGFNLLETISRSGVIKPDNILNELHRSIRYLLKQNHSDNRDGMDMSVCVIKDNGRRLEFAGAKNPLYYITDGKLIQIKGDPVPIGGLQKENQREFTMHSIEITSPTCFYIFSDGYADQFGGNNECKFSSRQFKNLLLEIHELPMSEQKEILNQKILDWMGEKSKQLDDIIVIGFKLGDKHIEFS
ncbi:MAG: tetratricopeptide repeat protein [Bacteroidales bacterium]|nr:tetratricopeptide repeat protein [Bacteroidales bacterium]